ncbi:uncharacterized protein LOC142352121 [Convolutriloba macropyga]|uniref:uncharacterized protein LOC142352121 n=1 Tax=Convolutriloba macropyga TaxID=536237 RepID=UPI003F522F8B
MAEYLFCEPTTDEGILVESNWEFSSSDFALQSCDIPDDLQGFDLDEFLGIQADVSGSQIDVDVLLSSKFPEKSPNDTMTAENSEELSPNSDDSGFFTPKTRNENSGSGECYQNFEINSGTNLHEMTAVQLNNSGQQFYPVTSNSAGFETGLNNSQIVGYAVIPDNNSTGTRILQPVTIGPVLETDCNVIENQNNEVSIDQFELDSDIDFNFDDDQDPISDRVLFAGSATTTLPVSYKTDSCNNSNKLTDEERLLLSQEGVKLPENMPLTKMEERILKKVRRKIRNRQSAHVSRQKKKDYVRNLEMRVKKCTDSNSQLQIQIEKLEQENSSLVKQLTHLKLMISLKMSANARRHAQSLNATTGTCLMMVVFACCFLMFPPNNEINKNRTTNNQLAFKDMPAVVSRTLLGEKMGNQDRDQNLFAEFESTNQISPFDLKLLNDNEQKSPNMETSKVRDAEMSYDDLVAEKLAENDVIKSVNFSEIEFGGHNTIRHRDL